MPCCEVFICDKDFHSNRLISLAGLWSPWKSRWKEGIEKAQPCTKCYKEADTSIYATENQASAGQKSQRKGIHQESCAEDAVNLLDWG